MFSCQWQNIWQTFRGHAMREVSDLAPEYWGVMSDVAPGIVRCNSCAAAAETYSSWLSCLLTA